MRRDATATGAWTRLVVRGLERLEIDVHALCETLGISYAALVDPDARVACDDQIRLWNLAEQRTGDRNLGVRTSEHVKPTANHVHTHLILSSRNLRDAILAQKRSLPIVGHGTQVWLEEQRDAFRIGFEHSRGDLLPGPQAVEFTAAVLRRIWGLAQGTLLPLRAVGFAHPCPGDRVEVERVLGCPVQYSQAANTMVVTRDVMLRISPHYSAELTRQLLELADACMARLSQPSFVAELGMMLRSRLQSGPCDADSVAAELHLGLRTLQRRLAEEQTSFSEVLDRVRRELALELIQADLPLSEIAARCGFSDSRALSRAFRRWMGTTPSLYRGAAPPRSAER